MDFASFFKDKIVLVTGGCGFIGSHIVDAIHELGVGQILIIDDFSAETDKRYCEKYSNVKLLEYDIRDDLVYEQLPNNIDIIIHLAAQPSVPKSVQQPYFDFDVNVIGTLKLLEFARETKISDFVFAASGGTVYGEAEQIPTPEFYPLRPISNYGASKAAVEMYLSSYAHLYGMRTTSMRFGNVYGPRSTHGVMFDFYSKLKKDNSKLLILGDGKQEKSFLYIDDCVQGFLYAATRETDGFKAINMAAYPTVNVDEIAKKMTKILQLSPELEYTGGSRGWKGDVRRGELVTSELQKLGWNQSTNIDDGIASYVSWLHSYYLIKPNMRIGKY